MLINLLRKLVTKINNKYQPEAVQEQTEEELKTPHKFRHHIEILNVRKLNNITYLEARDWNIITTCNDISAVVILSFKILDALLAGEPNTKAFSRLYRDRTSPIDKWLALPLERDHVNKQLGILRLNLMDITIALHTTSMSTTNSDRLCAYLLKELDNIESILKEHGY